MRAFNCMNEFHVTFSRRRVEVTGKSERIRRAGWARRTDGTHTHTHTHTHTQKRDTIAHKMTFNL